MFSFGCVYHNIFLMPKKSMSIPSILVPFQAATLISEGYISALVSDLRKLPEYWAGMLKDFPRHPVKDADPELRASIGCTRYGFLACKHQSFSLRGWGGRIL